MRTKFFKYLKRFFIILPIIMMLMQIVFSMGSYWRDNGTSDFILGDDDFIQRFVNDGNANEITNPLVYNYTDNYQEQTIIWVINNSFRRLYTIITGDGGYSDLYSWNPYSFIIINFLTWWVFVEIMFLFFRFVTFLISWVNSLFDRCFNKINKG